MGKTTGGLEVTRASWRDKHPAILPHDLSMGGSGIVQLWFGSGTGRIGSMPDPDSKPPDPLRDPAENCQRRRPSFSIRAE
jgi:hypothetical protein